MGTASTKGHWMALDGLFARVGTARWLGFSSSAWIAVLVVVLGLVALHRTRFGQYVVGIGAAEESVRRAGVDVRRVKLWTLTLSGLAAGVAGMLIAARLGSGSANSARTSMARIAMP